ncbi:lasso peptide biosynthesis PqqD family chaperone [Methanobacterium sp. ACI-7]|uniref:lasso peptide biosynthesis PqqD family chaperone n=1 Tax=unclassified Methanobacterium TaxID=2627676 RepID=UPI0039C4C9D8
MNGEKLTLDSIVVTSKSVVYCDLDGEAAMLNMEDGVYYGLNEVGATIWNLIQEPRKVSEVLKNLLEEYEVREDECKDDLMNVLRELLEKGLIEIK